MHNTDIVGFPYFPGTAVGKLQRGIDAITENTIALIKQDAITSLPILPAGLIIIDAAPFSHKMIALLELGLPTVLISTQQAALFHNSETVHIDGANGRITNNIIEKPDALSAKAEESIISKIGHAVSFADGERVKLYASVRRPSAARQAVELGAEAIGLVRSEFFMPEDGELPDAVYYQRAFRNLCEASIPLPVTFRLLDIAADKKPAWLPSSSTIGLNLGLQGVRLFSIDPVASIIDAQLTTISNLSSEFNLRLLIPYIVRIEEFDYWQNLIRQRIPEHIPVGAMAETPASVLDIKQLLECADFVAIGCNDLMQNLYAADRDQAILRHYLDPYAPVLFRLLRQIADQAGDNVNRIQLCGVLSQIHGILPVLLGLGYRIFSVDAPFIPHLSRIVVSMSRKDCEIIAEQVCSARTTQDVLEILKLPADRHSPFLTN